MSNIESVDVPGPSTVQEEEDVAADNLCSESSKLRMKDAFLYYQHLLEQNNLMAAQSSGQINDEAMLLAEDIYEFTIQTQYEKKFITDNELIMFDEIEEENAYQEIPSNDSSDDEDYEPKDKRTKRSNEYISLDYKIKAVNIAKAHPGWSLKSLQSKGCHRLKRYEDLAKWEQHIEKGGTLFDKYAVVDSWTYDRFKEARENQQQVTTRNLQQWALAAASQFTDFDFKASKSWVSKFKRMHKIRQRKITKFVTERETTTIDETLAAAEDFRIQTRYLIPNFDRDFVINTEQTDCQYQSTFDRTLATQGSKVVLVKMKNMNKVTHSYTAQYAVTLSGKLLPLVFICLQEPTGSFGPRVQKTVDEYLQKYKNVVVTSSKSGKLTTKLYMDFLVNVLKPYVGEKKFLLLIDSWGGQTNTAMYDEIFKDEARLPTCTVKIIPPKCTPLVQPCDVYFFRQVKHFIKRLQNCAYLLEREREINSREDCLKIHSIVHHQLSSPIFGNMIRYAWHASIIIDDKEIFMNVNEVCFPMEILKKNVVAKIHPSYSVQGAVKRFAFLAFMTSINQAPVKLWGKSKRLHDCKKNYNVMKKNEHHICNDSFFVL